MVTAGSRGRKGNVNRIIKGMNREGRTNQLHPPAQPGRSTTTCAACPSTASPPHLSACPESSCAALLPSPPARRGPRSTTGLTEVTAGVLPPPLPAQKLSPEWSSLPVIDAIYYFHCLTSYILTINEEEAQKCPEH